MAEAVPARIVVHPRDVATVLEKAYYHGNLLFQALDSASFGILDRRPLCIDKWPSWLACPVNRGSSDGTGLAHNLQFVQRMSTTSGLMEPILQEEAQRFLFHRI